MKNIYSSCPKIFLFKVIIYRGINLNGEIALRKEDGQDEKNQKSVYVFGISAYVC